MAIGYDVKAYMTHELRLYKTIKQIYSTTSTSNAEEINDLPNSAVRALQKALRNLQISGEKTFLTKNKFV